MIITKTPMRMSFLGGGSDLPVSIAKWGGVVLGSTINQFSYITCRKLPQFFDYKTRLMYSKLETVQNNKDIKHRVINQVIKYLLLGEEGLEISHMADLPSYSGTGSSSSFIVGLLNTLSALKNKKLLPQDLYSKAIIIEQVILEDAVGYQDSAWASFGGMNVIRWNKKGEINIEKIYLEREYLTFLKENILLFHTGILREASSITSSYIIDKEKQHMELMKLAEEGVGALKECDLKKLGKLIHRSWEIKQSLSDKVSNSTIDKMFTSAMREGAYGGKLLGAGGGGCIMFVVNPSTRKNVEHIMESYGAIKIDYDFEPNGSQIILGG